MPKKSLPTAPKANEIYQDGLYTTDSTFYTFPTSFRMHHFPVEQQ